MSDSIFIARVRGRLGVEALIALGALTREDCVEAVYKIDQAIKALIEKFAVVNTTQGYGFLLPNGKRQFEGFKINELHLSVDILKT
jgi:hypothetical protein